MILVKWVLFKLHNTFSLQKKWKERKKQEKRKKTIFSLSIWTNMANKALFECGIWSKTLHSGAKSHGRGIRDFKHQNPTYLVSLESSSHPEIIFDNFEKYGH